MTNPGSMCCVHCREDKRIVHYWRTDNVTQCWIDDFKCLSCGHRWKVETLAFDYEEAE